MKNILDPQFQKFRAQALQWLEKSGLKARLEPQLARYRALDEEKRKQVKTGLVFAAIALNLLMVLGPLVAEWLALNQKIQKVVAEVKIAKSDINAKDHMAEALAEAEKATAETERRTFKKDQVHQFLDVLSEMAKESNVKIESLAPFQPKTAADEMPRPLPKGYSLAGFEMQGRAGYHEFGKLIERLEKGAPFVKIETVEVYHDVSFTRTSHQVKLRFLLIQRS